MVRNEVQLLGGDGVELGGGGLGDGELGDGEQGGVHKVQVHKAQVHKVQVHMVQDGGMEQRVCKEQALDDMALVKASSRKLVGLVCIRMGLGDEQRQHRRRRGQPQPKQVLSGNKEVGGILIIVEKGIEVLQITKKWKGKFDYEV